jgi:hypothetical protein
MPHRLCCSLPGRRATTIIDRPLLSRLMFQASVWRSWSPASLRSPGGLGGEGLLTSRGVVLHRAQRLKRVAEVVS